MPLPDNGKFLTRNGLTHLIKLIKDAINEEKTDRINTDNGLSNRIEAVEAFKDTTVPSTYATKVELSTETSARSELGNTLQSNIDAEAQTRLENDETLKENIEAEIIVRETNDNALTTNLNKEIQDRKDAINSEASTRSSADSTLTTNLNKEIQDRIDAINSESSARSTADSALDSRVVNLETFKNTTVPGTYATISSLSTETTNRTNADNALSGRITTLENTKVVVGDQTGYVVKISNSAPTSGTSNSTITFVI